MKNSVDSQDSASVKIDANKLTVTIAIDEHASATGKTVVIASTGGNKVLAMYKNKPLYVGLNAYIPAK